MTYHIIGYAFLFKHKYYMFTVIIILPCLYYRIQAQVTVRKGDTAIWKRIFLQLPDGVFQVVIEATRDNDGLGSGLLLDDLTLWHCGHYGMLKYPSMYIHLSWYEKSQSTFQLYITG